MATRGNIPPGKETLKIYIDKGLKRRLRLKAADWDRTYSSIVEQGLELILEHDTPIRGVEGVEWKEDREQLQADRTGEARMVYSAKLGEFYGTIYEARDGTCVWYVRDADGNEMTSGEAGRVVDAEEAAQRAAAEHGEECHICSENGIVTPATRYALGMHLCDACAREYERYLQPGERLEDMTMDEMHQRI